MVCGASQGIGEAVARELAGLGCRVVGLARSEEKLSRVIAALDGSGHVVMVQNLGDRTSLTRKIQAFLEREPIQILVNNAGGPKPGPLAHAEEEHFLQGFENHVLASALLVRLLLPGMKNASFGRIVNIISTSVKAPIPNLGVSNTIRGAMASLAKTLSLEVAPFGVTVNNVLPGYTDTPRLETLIANAAKRTGRTVEETAAEWQTRVPSRRFAQPAEIAAAVAFLASPAAAYINGINLPVDGGRTDCL